VDFVRCKRILNVPKQETLRGLKKDILRVSRPDDWRKKLYLKNLRSLEIRLGFLQGIPQRPLQETLRVLSGRDLNGYSNGASSGFYIGYGGSASLSYAPITPTDGFVIIGMEVGLGANEKIIQVEAAKTTSYLFYKF